MRAIHELKKSTSKTVLFCFPFQTVVMWFVYDTKCLALLIMNADKTWDLILLFQLF